MCLLFASKGSERGFKCIQCVLVIVDSPLVTRRVYYMGLL